jgi:hypothetical protein
MLTGVASHTDCRGRQAHDEGRGPCFLDVHPSILRHPPSDVQRNARIAVFLRAPPTFGSTEAAMSASFNPSRTSCSAGPPRSVTPSRLLMGTIQRGPDQGNERGQGTS